MSLLRSIIQRCSGYWFRSRTRFGLLSYTTSNLGDFIQSLAARNLLPAVDQYVDREQLDEVCSSNCEPFKLILNGWFCHRPDKWPPSSIIRPLLISFHVTNNPEPGSGMRARQEFAAMPLVLKYLRQNGPVGARDLGTLAWLRSHDIDGYYSGCLTLTLDRPVAAQEAFIVLNDVPEVVAARVKRKTMRPIIKTTHEDPVTTGAAARLRRAALLVETYAKASCVVTTRLHGAMPCLAMGTPVLLIDASWDQSRFVGLNELVHHCTVEQFILGEFDYDVDRPPANPVRHLAMRADLQRRVAAFVGL